jgi:hypothetical protein
MQRERARWPNQANSTIASMQEFVAHVQRNFFPDAGSEGAIGGNDDNTLAVAGHADLAGLLINGISAKLLRAKVDRCRTHGDWTASPPASRSGNMVWMPENRRASAG